MILVTGGGGVLGHALVAELERNALPFHVVSSGDVDLRDAATTDNLFQTLKPSLVYHLAARVHGLGGNSRFPAEMFTDNIRINTNVIDAARKFGCKKIIAVSTVAIYSSDATMPVNEASVWFDRPHHSEAAYGHAKRAMLVQLEACATQYGLSFAYPIMTNIYGPHDRFDLVNGHVIPSLIAKFHNAATTGSAVRVWGSGIAERDFISASDAARALMLIAQHHEGPINVATGDVVSIKNIVGLLADYTGIDRIEWDPSKPDGQILRRYDVSALKSLGFQLETPLSKGLAETYDWFSKAFPNVRT